jgi:hypothetical protein
LISKQRTYSIEPILINDVRIVEVMIDSHYEEKHQASMNDELILNLVKELNGRRQLPDTSTDQFSYSQR